MKLIELCVKFRSFSFNNKEKLNKVHLKIQFTVEEDGQLLFLDVHLLNQETNKQGRLHTLPQCPRHKDKERYSHSKFAILHMRTCPPVGGDTLWANAYKAYDELSAPMKALCDGLSALHDASPHLVPEKRHIHPVVRVHPDTGRRSLFVNEHFTRRIVELSAAESRMLLNFLTGWIHQPRFTVRYRWTAGTVAMWDNRCTQHHVLDDFEGERIIQRVTVMGDDPQPAQPSPWEPFGSRTASFWRDAPMRDQLRRQFPRDSSHG